ncbi:MAG: hypothetical protein LWW95_10155 [Candidatus Desulfofervidus auxilii]|nr:hypothetical protein [Candidatus Desulfofervidus auxilii]
MSKTIIALIALLALNGCSAFLPSVSDKSNNMLHQKEWQPINGDKIKGSVK